VLHAVSEWDVNLGLELGIWSLGFWISHRDWLWSIRHSDSDFGAGSCQAALAFFGREVLDESAKELFAAAARAAELKSFSTADRVAPASPAVCVGRTATGTGRVAVPASARNGKLPLWRAFTSTIRRKSKAATPHLDGTPAVAP